MLLVALLCQGKLDLLLPEILLASSLLSNPSLLASSFHSDTTFFLELLQDQPSLLSLLFGERDRPPGLFAPVVAARVGLVVTLLFYLCFEPLLVQTRVLGLSPTTDLLVHPFVEFGHATLDYRAAFKGQAFILARANRNHFRIKLTR